MAYAAEKSFFKAVFANVPISVKKGIWTDKTKIVYCLNEFNFFLFGSVVAGKADQRQSVVNMNDIDMIFMNHLPDFSVTFQ